MSGTALMNLGTRAMFANYAALQTTSHNIANANTAGYSRQQAQFATSEGQYTGAGFFGQGVNVQSVTRSYDRFLTNQAIGTKSAAAADSARRDQLALLEGVFTTGETGLGYAAGQLVNSFVDVANSPGDISARQVVISRVTDIAARFAAAGEQIAALQGSVVEDVRASVASVNGIARQIAVLNGQISSFNGTGQVPNDLLDSRDKLISDMSQYIGVTTVAADDGSVGVFIGAGQSLVLGSTVNMLQAVPDAYDPARVTLAMREGSMSRLVPQQSINGGSISGQLAFQNGDLVEARNGLGQLAGAISGAMNLQQALGVDLTGRHGTALFAVGEPRTLAASSNTGDARFGLTVTDATLVTAADYELRFDGAQYTIDRLNADGTRTAVGGSPLADVSDVNFDGLNLHVNSGSLLPGDRFLLQPTANAAQGMKPVLRDPNGIAAASPVTTTFGVANTGTASLAWLSAVSPVIDETLLPATIAFGAPLGDGTGRMAFDITNADGSVASDVWTPGQPISFNGFALVIDGVPKPGDTAQVRTGVVGGNNGNALAFARLATASLVGAGVTAQGTPVPGRNFTDAYANAMSNVAVRVQSARSSADTSTSFANAAESARSNKAGVNLDEEAARLIQFQQAYQAAAKVLQVAQSVFDTLLKAGGA